MRLGLMGKAEGQLVVMSIDSPWAMQFFGTKTKEKPKCYHLILLPVMFSNLDYNNS